MTDWATGAGGRLNLFTGLEWFDESAASGGSWDWVSAVMSANNSTRNGFADWRLATLNEALAAARDQSAVSQGIVNSPFGTNVPYWTATLGSKVQGKQQYWRVHFREPEREPEQHSNGYLALLITTRDTARYVDDGNAGFTTIGTWSTTTGGSKPKPLTGYLGDARTAAAGNGTATATWTFTGLEPGATYKVATTWTANSTYATNAPYNVSDGPASLGTVAVNQRLAPDDFEVAGQKWEGLGVFTTNSGTLDVRLTNTTTGPVMADAVRIFQVYPGFGGGPLRAAGEPAGGSTPAPLTQAQLRPIVAEAVRRWTRTGLTPAEAHLLKSVQFQIADLDGAALGQAAGTTITLDATAAGHGWFVDPSPRSDSEFTRKGDQGEQRRMDLLTAVMHELGHVLGRGHGDGAMAETLTAGTRESVVPGVRLATAAVAKPAFGPGWFLASGRTRR